MDLDDVWSIQRNVSLGGLAPRAADRLTHNASKGFYSRHGGMKGRAVLYVCWFCLCVTLTRQRNPHLSHWNKSNNNQRTSMSVFKNILTLTVMTGLSILLPFHSHSFCYYFNLTYVQDVLPEQP